MRVFIDPIYNSPDRADGGIRRVSEAMVKHLPSFGWDVTSTPDDADLIANHGAALTERMGVPMVCHNHGLMWADYGFGDWGDKVNKAVIETLTRASAITAPSKWVAQAISRGMLAKPTVIYHGVDADDWAHNKASLGYVLWNKARADQVSDPYDMQRVAELLPHVRFVSTFGEPTQNVMLLGAVTYEDMRPVVQQAGVYLATARETFGIGTIEALAAGVPVAGWRYGGQEEIVKDGETGYLAEYGDYDALAMAVMRCLHDRDRLSPRCVEDARSRWGWKDKIAQYAALYTQVVEEYTAPRPKVSVIVTCHNLARYLGEALDSVIIQTTQDWECLIIDDASTDDTHDVVIKHWDRRFQYLPTPTNLRLSGARNYGFEHANGRYILFLDADDLLAPNALDLLSTALDNRTDIHIAYGHLDTFNDPNPERSRGGWPGDQFNWHGQIAHLNQLPYAALVRREVFERSGGYRTRDWRAEDASLWTRLTSFGFRAAKVTEESTLIYRFRSDSKSADEARAHQDRDGDWTAWYPWRLAGDPYDGIQATNEGRQPNPLIVPFGAQGQPPRPLRCWPVHHHQAPIVSVIIPVGPGHAEYLIDALDSVQAQTMPFWECIVVNDTGKPLDLRAHPWARAIEAGGLGAGAARNRGIAAARAPLVLFLDADDVIVPRALETLIWSHAEHGNYVYSDWLTLEDERKIDGPMIVRQVEDYDQRAMLRGLRHAVTALIPTDWVRAVGGFDEQLKGFEDWDLFCKLAIMGYCGTRAPHPLLIYRRATGMRTRALLLPRENDEQIAAYTPLGEATAAALYDRYAAYTSGEEPIMGCCGGNQSTAVDVQSMLSQFMGEPAGERFSAPIEGGPVRMEFIGSSEGAQTYIGRVSGQIYRAGRDPNDRYHDVDPRDVEHFVRTELFRVVPRELLARAAHIDDGQAVPAMEPRATTGRQRGRAVR